MLVLKRKPEQVVVIHVPGYDHPIEIMVCGIEGRSVRLGFQAPSEVQFVRAEIAS